ncbi:MAG TPA: FAD-dependent monooxygenase [Candidatus Binataceae bacterium]|nr:FAD-dependent monooxygenase [Candidatus Binataceae bacterium]
MEQSPVAQVLIAGAGPTGLVLALWLIRLGVRVRIIDQTAAAAPYSRALGVQARTLEFYRQIGIADAAVARGVQSKGVNFWVAGTRAAHIPFENLGAGLTPFPFILDFAQDAHERLLIGHLETLGVKVERTTELVRFDQQGGFVRATLKRPDGSEEICEPAYLAGCDGASSIVRETIGAGFPGGTYSHLFYVADVEASGPPIDNELHVDLDTDDLLVIFPMKGDGRVRLVGTVRDHPARADHELTFADVSDRSIKQLKLVIAKVNWFSTYRVHHRVAQNFRKGRAFLLGDAAHIHSPVGGQGMNTGIGDAINLAWKLAAVLDGRASERLLDTYELERIGFARRLVATTDRIFTLATKPGFIAEQIRTRLFPLIAPIMLRVPIVRSFMFRTVSQIGLSYRASPLSAGVAGTLHGGDRLPWIQFAAGAYRDADNFTALTSLAWQVHIYGEPHGGVAEACAALALPIHVFPWAAAMEQAGVMRSATYLIRPDGYIALADPNGDPERLRSYFQQLGSAASPPQRTSS